MDERPTKRFQFNLSTLLLLMVIVDVVCRVEMHYQREAAAARAAALEHANTYGIGPSAEDMKKLKRLLLDHAESLEAPLVESD